MSNGLYLKVQSPREVDLRGIVVGGKYIWIMVSEKIFGEIAVPDVP